MEMEPGKIYKVINMLDNGLMEKYKDMEYIQPHKDKNIKDILLISLNMEKLKKNFQMEICSKEIILMENHKVLVFINLKNIIWSMKVILIKASEMDMESSQYRISLFIKVSSKMIRLKDMESYIIKIKIAIWAIL